MEHILQNLEELNIWLKKNNKFIELHLIGGFAIYLHGINLGRETEDIDNINEITDQSIIDKIHEIGEKHSTEKWFDLGAPTLSLPRGYKIRLKAGSHLSNIKIYLLSREDLISLKIAAYYSRRERGIIRDILDLKILCPSLKEIDIGINFTYESVQNEGHLQERFLGELKEELNLFHEELKNELSSK